MPRWPGISVGTARVRGLGRLRFFATSSDQSQLTYITVEHGGVILSARDPNAFRAGLIERVERYDAVPAEERDAYDAFQQGRGDRPAVGPYTLLLHMPEMARRLEALRTYLRAEPSLPQPGPYWTVARLFEDL